MRTRPCQLELSPKIEHLVLDLIREGVALVDVAEGLNLGERSLRRWLSEGRHSSRAPYHQFATGYSDATLERKMVVANLLDEARKQLRAR
jgi:hypothetical protein